MNSRHEYQSLIGYVFVNREGVYDIGFCRGKFVIFLNLLQIQVIGANNGD